MLSKYASTNLDDFIGGGVAGDDFYCRFDDAEAFGQQFYKFFIGLSFFRRRFHPRPISAFFDLLQLTFRIPGFYLNKDFHLTTQFQIHPSACLNSSQFTFHGPEFYRIHAVFS